MTIGASNSEPSASIDEVEWYHTIDLPDGSSTPGRYDLRPIVSRLPIPASLEGKRCLDIGSRDGFYAFEMEKRGAAEVVSLDINDPDEIAFPCVKPPRDVIQAELDAGNRAFKIASEALSSSVERRFKSAYTLDPTEDGTFDFAIVATLLLHLRDPIGALTAARSVIDGQFLINEVVATNRNLARRTPLAELWGLDGRPFWWLGNPAMLRRMAEAAGFHVKDSGRPYFVPNGSGTPHESLSAGWNRSPRELVRGRLLRRGALHAWVLADTSP